MNEFSSLSAMHPEFVLLNCQLNTGSDVLFFLSPSSTLWESRFPFCWFFFRSMLPRKDQMADVATLLADGPLLEAFRIHMSASSTASSFSSALVCFPVHFLSNGLLNYCN